VQLTPARNRRCPQKEVAMSWLKLSAAIGVLAAQVTTTLAADMPGTLPPPRDAAPIVDRRRPSFDIYSGWYIRGDIGYEWGTLSSAQSASGFADPTSNKLGNGMTGGLGVGVKTEWLRTDITVDYYAPLKYEGQVVTPGDTVAKISGFSALFNGYIDLGSWYRVTPYIGAGAGAARMSVFDYQSTAAPPFTGGTSNNQWKFAFAGMAGVGIKVAPNVMLDVGYRYVNFGDLKSGSDASGAMTFKNVAAHEARVGLRWSFDDLPVYR
jgi:opacity protein-like surface antigen